MSHAQLILRRWMRINFMAVFCSKAPHKKASLSLVKEELQGIPTRLWSDLSVWPMLACIVIWWQSCLSVTLPLELPYIQVAIIS